MDRLLKRWLQHIKKAQHRLLRFSNLIERTNPW
jgi:hypothetical protein